MAEWQNHDTRGIAAFSLREGVQYTKPPENSRKELPSAAASGGVQSQVIPGGKPAAPVAAGAGKDTAALAVPTSPTPPADPVSILKAALEQAGISITGLRFSYADDFVTYPGGGYANRQITVELPNGRKESFSADLMQRNPQVTVVEIQGLMRPR